MSYLDIIIHYTLRRIKEEYLLKVSLALFYRILNIFRHTYTHDSIVRIITRCAYYRTYRRNQENSLKTEVMLEGSFPLSGIT